MLGLFSKNSKSMLLARIHRAPPSIKGSKMQKNAFQYKTPILARQLRRCYMVPSFSSTSDSFSDSIIVTSAVAERINQLRQEDKNKNIYLRIVVDSGGCNGFLAKFELDTKAFSKDDIVVKKDGADVVLDELSMGLMKGSTIDYIDEMSRSTFVIVENPNAGTSCGCNTSFSLKDAK